MDVRRSSYERLSQIARARKVKLEQLVKRKRVCHFLVSTLTLENGEPGNGELIDEVASSVLDLETKSFLEATLDLSVPLLLFECDLPTLNHLCSIINVSPQSMVTAHLGRLLWLLSAKSNQRKNKELFAFVKKVSGESFTYVEANAMARN